MRVKIDVPQDRLDRVHEANNWQDRNDRAAEAASLQRHIFAQMTKIMDAASDGLKADEARAYDKLEKIYDELEQIAVDRVDRVGVVAPSGVTAKYRKDAPLMRGQTFEGYARAMGHTEPDEVRDALGEAGRQLDLGKFLQGAFTGDWRDAEPERLLNVLSGATSGAGGVLLPTILTSRIIDAARNQTRVMQAGAVTVPMENRTVDVPRWLTDPTLGWRAENDPIAVSDATMDKITLEAKSLAAVTKVSRELVEDTDITGELERAFGLQLALTVDAAALYGTGSSNQPEGVKSNSDVTKTALATNGASPAWAALVNSVGRLRDVNEEPTAQIMADRTQRSLAQLADTTGQFIAPPSYLDGIPRLSTNQVPLNLTTGTNSDTSDIFTADWTQLLIGVRTNLQITLLQERYMPDAGQYGFVAWWRGDIGVARPKAFDVVTGVRP